MEGLLAFGTLITVLRVIVSIVAFIIVIIVCVSIERTKNEAIRTNELLENINKIQIALYKKEFGISSEKSTATSTPLESVPESSLKFTE